MGNPRLGADPHDLRTAGDYYYRIGEFARAREFYGACSGGGDGQLRAACHWAIGATLLAEARLQADEDVRHEQELGLPPRSPASLDCTPAADEFRHALAVLRVAHRLHATARRALVIATLHEELSHGARSECRPRDCPDLPFGWHRRSGEIEVLGSGLEGSSRARVFACFGEPGQFSSDTWIYSQGKCTSPQVVMTTLRLHFDGDIVDRVTHQRSIDARDCGLQTSF